MADVPPRMPHTYDIGILSRLNKMKSPGKTYDVLVLLSGPEPQRTILERILCEQLQNTTWQVCLVRGTHGKSDIASNSQITILDYLLSSQLEEILNSSRHVICRAGYSTIMDLVKVGKKALLIPTPGQTEQEYLAEYLKSRGYFYSVSQDALNINRDLPVSDRYLPPKLATGKQLADRVKGVMQQLENHKS
jgi:predicted glycosyltransferase